MLHERALHVMPILIAVALAGCVGPGLGLGADDPGTGPLTENRTVDQGVELTATIDPGSAAPDEPVDTRFRARNVGDEPVRYREGCWNEWSLEIVAVEGDDRYRYPQATCQGFSQEKLEPGEVHEAAFEMAPDDWSSERSPPPGMYRLDVGFAFQDRGPRDVTTTLRLDVTEG